MLTNCKDSCDKVMQHEDDNTDVPASFYDIIETDLFGKVSIYTYPI